MARRRVNRQRRRGRGSGEPQFPFTRITRLPVDPPPFTQIPQLRRTVQLTIVQPASGDSVSIHPSDYLISSLGLSNYRAFMLRRVRVWTSTFVTTPPTLEVIPGSESSASVPIVQYSDRGSASRAAAVGYYVRGSYSGPWAGNWIFVVIRSSAYPCIVEISAVFM